jgi:ABC-type transport system involved in cytochrome bd biosynthesis fused ATPase/permease subunit
MHVITGTPARWSFSLHRRRNSSLRVCCSTGPSGAGKSTLLNLITRLYDPTSGTILLDGEIDISQVRGVDLAKLISIIDQEPRIFNRSLMENLTYGAKDTADWRVEEARGNRVPPIIPFLSYFSFLSLSIAENLFFWGAC